MAADTASKEHAPSRQSSSRDPESQGTSARPEPWWKIHLFRGMIDDLRRRVPYYASDWLDAWDYRVVPATIYMYFAK
jgi:hypothetical protein